MSIFLGTSIDLNRCYGRYCGRVPALGGNFSDCQACPWGYRTAPSYQYDIDDECSLCTKDLNLPGWFYLVFMSLLPWLSFVCRSENLHLKYLTKHDTKSLKSLVLNKACCNSIKIPLNGIVLNSCHLFETALSFIVTVLVFRPYSEMRLFACDINGVSDFYPIFHNPLVNYTETIYCSQEVVYPLYSFMFVFYGLLAAVMLVFRCFLLIILCFNYDALVRARNSLQRSLCTSLFLLPTFALVHAVFCGLLYYSFPYLALILLLISNVIMFIRYRQQNPLLSGYRQIQPANVALIILHLVLYVFILAAITGMTTPKVHAPLCLLAFVPSLFYLATARLSKPDHMNNLTIKYGDD